MMLTRPRSRGVGVARLAPGLLVAMGAALVITTGGCATVPKRTEVMDKLGVAPTTRQLRARVNDLALSYTLAIQSIADNIRSRFKDPEVQRTALRWKIDAVGMGTVAFFRTDPLVAYFDAWLLTVQMRQFFEHTTDDNQLKGAWTLAAGGCRDLEQEFVRAAAIIGKPERIEEVRSFIEKWASEHPLHDLRLARDSIEPFMERLVADQRITVVSVAGTIPDALDDLSHQVHFYMWFMPKQVRSESELMAEELLAGDLGKSPGGQQVLASLRDFAALARELTALLRNARSSIEKERAGILDLLARERDLLYQEISRQRNETIEALKKERALVLEAVHAERVAAMHDAEGIAQRTVDHGIAQSYQLVDRVFLRVAEILFAIGIAVGIAWLIYILVRRRRSEVRLHERHGAL